MEKLVKSRFLDCDTYRREDTENTSLNVQKRNIKGTTTQVVDEDVALLVRLASTETIGDSSGSRLVNDTEDVEASNGTSILGSLTLVVVEIGWDSDDGLGDGFSELGLSDLFHLWTSLAPSHVACCVSCTNLHEDHRRDLLGREGLGLAEVLDLDDGVAALVNDLEGPGLSVLLDDVLVESPTDQTPSNCQNSSLIVALPTGHLT